jgi:probable rRNA maturation factor
VTEAPRVRLADRQRSLRLDGRRLAREVEEVLRRVRFPGDLSLVLVDDREMGRLHGAFSGDPTPTDVLAFPFGGPNGGPGVGKNGGPGSARPLPRRRRGGGILPPGSGFPAGEVVLSVETAVREARARDLRPRTEVLLYAVHGILHLMGEDDHDPVKARRMDRRTLRLLGLLGYRHRIGRRV